MPHVFTAEENMRIYAARKDLNELMNIGFALGVPLSEVCAQRNAVDKTLRDGWDGFEEHKSPKKYFKQCGDGTWTCKSGDLVRWKGIAHGKPVQGMGTVVGIATYDLGPQASSELEPQTQWIVELSYADATRYIPGGFCVTVFYACDLRSVSA